MKCPMCKTEVETNGIGPSNSPKFSWFLTTIYKKSCKLFHDAGNLHDLNYHIYGTIKEDADSWFLEDMKLAIKRNKCNWFSRRWYNYQMNKFHLAVVVGGQKSFDEAQLVCMKQMNLNTRDIG